MDQLVEGAPERVVLEPEAVEALADVLRLYMLSDYCVCDEDGPCSDDCDMCIYCCGKLALKGIGEKP